MLSIVIFSVVALFTGKFIWLLYIEISAYILFLGLIMTGQCFFLIRQQTILDVLIKMRIMLAMYYAQRKKNFLFRVDETLGYTLAKNKKDDLTESNAWGIRSDREYSLKPPNKVLRMAAFGDSFVFCDGERNENTWPHYLENSASNLEVLNFGLSGYGLGQAYLRFLQDGIKFSPDIIFLNYVHLTARDQTNLNEILKIDNIRAAHCYRVNFGLENGNVTSKSSSPFDLFDRAFRKNRIFKPWGLNDPADFRLSKLFSTFNIVLLIKQWILKTLYVNRPPLKSAMINRNEALNIQILQDIIEQAKIINSRVIFFYNSAFENLGPAVQTLFEKHKDTVVYVNAIAALNEEFGGPTAKPDQYMNISNHFNAKGNRAYSNAVLKILKSRSWGHGIRNFIYDSKLRSFNNINQIQHITNS